MEVLVTRDPPSAPAPVCPSLERLALPILPKIQGSPMTWGSLNRYSIVRDIHTVSDNHYYYHIRYSDSRSVGTKRRYRSRVSPSRYAMEKPIPFRKGDRHSRPPALTLLSGLVSRMPAILRIACSPHSRRRLATTTTAAAPATAIAHHCSHHQTLHHLIIASHLRGRRRRWRRPAARRRRHQ